jgi:hypothetical protein
MGMNIYKMINLIMQIKCSTVFQLRLVFTDLREKIYKNKQFL